MAKRNVKLVEEMKLNHFRTQSFFLFYFIFFSFQNINSNIPSVIAVCIPQLSLGKAGGLVKPWLFGSALLAASCLTAVLQSPRLCLKTLSHAASLLMA